MREPGGGTLLPPVIEKAKPSVKVSTTTESNENRRQLSNGAVGAYASYGGTKSMLPGSILPPGAPFPASAPVKGSNSYEIFAQPHRHDNNELHLSSSERLKELRARLEPFLKPKTAQPTAAGAPAEESGGLPHWGLGKRSRRSRCEVSRHEVVHELAGKARGEVQAAEDFGVKLRGHSSESRPANVDATDAHFAKGAAPSRNSIASIALANMVLKTSSQTRQGNGAERERVPSRKAEAGGVGRQGSDGSAERPINGNSCQVGAHTMATKVTGLEMAAAATCPPKPRLDLQTPELPRILIGLSRKEKEDDFLIFKGSKLPQRPKRRPKAVERALHYCMPGNSLCDLSYNRYDVREKKCVRKKPRGLKAMESIESDSD